MLRPLTLAVFPTGTLRIEDRDVIHTLIDFLSYLKLKGRTRPKAQPAPSPVWSGSTPTLTHLGWPFFYSNPTRSSLGLPKPRQIWPGSTLTQPGLAWFYSTRSPAGAAWPPLTGRWSAESWWPEDCGHLLSSCSLADMGALDSLPSSVTSVELNP